MRRTLLPQGLGELALPQPHGKPRQPQSGQERQAPASRGASAIGRSPGLRLTHTQNLQEESASQVAYHKAVVVHVQNEVLAHDGQSDQCNVRSERSGEGTRKMCQLHSTPPTRGPRDLSSAVPQGTPFCTLEPGRATGQEARPPRPLRLSAGPRVPGDRPSGRSPNGEVAQRGTEEGAST